MKSLLQNDHRFTEHQTGKAVLSNRAPKFKCRCLLHLNLAPFRQPVIWRLGKILSGNAATGWPRVLLSEAWSTCKEKVICHQY